MNHDLNFLRHGEKSSGAVGGLRLPGTSRSQHVGGVGSSNRSPIEKFVAVIDFLQNLPPDNKVLTTLFLLLVLLMFPGLFL